MNPKKLTPKHNHNHFWIEDYTVYESYNTIRGVRYAPVAEVIMNDKEKLDETDIKLVNETLALN
jgi:hypothetical protein